MNIVPKIFIWVVSFIASFFIFTVVCLFHYIGAVFNLPFEVWEQIEEQPSDT